MLSAGIVAPSGGTAATASTVPTYFVSVRATATYDRSPQFDQFVSPALPQGASLTGDATCSQVYDSGTDGPAEPIVQGGSYSLDAGTYTFVTSSCSSDPLNPLSITGLAGPYQIQVLGDTYSITADSTKLLADSAEDTSTNPPTVTLAASVVDTSLDNGELPGQTVTFGFEGSIPTGNGSFLAMVNNVCSAVSTDNGDGVAVASCTLTSSQAQEFIQGTGAWTAYFAGGTDYKQSAVYGELGADTSPAQATQAVQTQYKSVTLVEHILPPNCHPSPDQTSVSIIGISLGELSCSEIQILQDITGATLGSVLILSGGAAFGYFGEAINAAWYLTTQSAFAAQFGSTALTVSALTALEEGAGLVTAAAAAGTAGGLQSLGQGG